jgi:putative phosphoesterase
LISDTHGHIGLDAIEALAGCDQVVHAGDLGPGVLERLSRLAPVIAVRGNNDIVEPEASLPTCVTAEFDGIRLSVVHRLKDAPRNGWDVLVYGHSHRRSAEVDGDRLIINPGAAGRAGFHDRRSVAILNVDNGIDWEFIDLGPRSAR